MDWYYTESGRQTGPVTDQQFALLIQSGQIDSQTLVWRQGLANWVPYGQLGRPAPPPIPPQLLLWRNKKLLVMEQKTRLPDRCVKCNAETTMRLKRNLSWHSPFLYLLIFAGVLVYLIVALVTRKTAVIEVGLCKEHFRKRTRDILISWIIFITAFGLFGYAIMFSNGWSALVGVLAVLTSLIYSSATTPIVSPQRIENRIWLKGVCADYLATLPEEPHK